MIFTIHTLVRDMIFTITLDDRLGTGAHTPVIHTSIHTSLRTLSPLPSTRYYPLPSTLYPGVSPNSLLPLHLLTPAPSSLLHFFAAPTVPRLAPGSAAGLRMVEEFCSDGRLRIFDQKRNDPNVDHCASNLSPYTHFGQLSGQRAAIVVKDYVRQHSSCSEGGKAFIEESVVRRELGDNYCFYNPLYDSLAGAAQWAQDSLELHTSDKREYLYSRDELEQVR